MLPVGTVPANNVVNGAWETYEMYIMFDSVAKSAGGQAEVRIWKNNTLLLDSTSMRTLVSTASYADYFYLFTYWNGNAPATTSLYVDDITITSDTPANRDSHGYPFIGGPQPKGGSPAPSPPATPAAPALTVH